MGFKILDRDRKATGPPVTVVGCCWLLLVAVGCCWLLLVAEEGRTSRSSGASWLRKEFFVMGIYLAQPRTETEPSARASASLLGNRCSRKQSNEDDPCVYD